MLFYKVTLEKYGHQVPKHTCKSHQSWSWNGWFLGCSSWCLTPWSSFWLLFLTRPPPPGSPESHPEIQSEKSLYSSKHKADQADALKILEPYTDYLHQSKTGSSSESTFILRDQIYFHVFRKVQFLWKFKILFSLCYWFISVNNTFCLVIVGTSLSSAILWRSCEKKRWTDRKSLEQVWSEKLIWRQQKVTR